MEYCLQKINQYYTKLKDKGVSFIFNSENKFANEQIQFPKIKSIENIIEGIKVIFDNINKDILDTIKKYLPKNINISDNELSII